MLWQINTQQMSVINPVMELLLYRKNKFLQGTFDKVVASNFDTIRCSVFEARLFVGVCIIREHWLVILWHFVACPLQGLS